MKYGIDKISLFNFKIDCKNNCKILNEEKDNKVIEKKIITDDLFTIVSTYSIFDDNGKLEEKFFNHISFNPNKILNGDNVRNSSIEDLKKTIEGIKKILRSKGIFIDFTEAKIAEIEINLNIPVDFQEYSEVFLLFIFQFKDPKYWGSFSNTLKKADFRAEESYQTQINKTSSFKIYDKSKESKIQGKKISRLEYKFGNDSYRYLTKLFYLSNSLQDLYQNENILEEIFIYRAKKDFLTKVFGYLENKIKPNLEKEYLRFKEANKMAIKYNKKTKRDVYRHLDDYWIFDYQFLNELIDKHDYYHKKREKDRIYKKFKHYDNLKKLEKIMNFILTTNTE